MKASRINAFPWYKSNDEKLMEKRPKTLYQNLIENRCHFRLSLQSYAHYVTCAFVDLEPNFSVLVLNYRADPLAYSLVAFGSLSIFFVHIYLQLKVNYMEIISSSAELKWFLLLVFSYSPNHYQCFLFKYFF